MYIGVAYHYNRLRIPDPFPIRLYVWLNSNRLRPLNVSLQATGVSESHRPKVLLPLDQLIKSSYSNNG